MRFPRNAKIFRGQLDIAPFAGVFFLLLILLLLRSHLVVPPGVRIELPRASGVAGAANPRIVVAIDARGNLYYENQAISAEQLRKELREAEESMGDPLTLVVLADRRTLHAEILELGMMAREVGLDHVVLGTRAKMQSEK